MTGTGRRVHERLDIAAGTGRDELAGQADARGITVAEALAPVARQPAGPARATAHG